MQKKTKRLVAVGAAVAAGALAVGVSTLPALAEDTGKSDGPSAKVINGTPAEEGEYPFIMRMTIDGQDGCAASLIRPDIALTAAHCTDAGSEFTVKYGSVDLESPDIKEVAVSEHTQSPDFGTPATFSSDWAVLKLETPIEDVEPVALAADDSLDLEEQTVIGWGVFDDSGEQSTKLLEANVPGVDDEKCAEAYGEDLDPDTMLCAGFYDEGGTDACQGDSGGPMGVVGEDGTFTQTGIVSWGQGCAEPKFPGVYAQVSGLVDDINAAADELSPA